MCAEILCGGFKGKHVPSRMLNAKSHVKMTMTMTMTTAMIIQRHLNCDGGYFCILAMFLDYTKGLLCEIQLKC